MVFNLSVSYVGVYRLLRGRPGMKCLQDWIYELQVHHSNLTILNKFCLFSVLSSVYGRLYDKPHIQFAGCNA